MVFTLLQFWECMSGNGQFNVLFVNPSFMDWTPRWENSNVEFHGQCAAGLRQARELVEGERNIQDIVLCRRAQLVTVGQSSTHCRRYDEREDTLSELYALPKRQSDLSIGTCWSEFVFC